MAWVSFLVAAVIIFLIFRMWRERRGVVVLRQDPAFDPTEGHPQAAEALDHLANANWSALTALYWRQPASDRYHLVQGLGEAAGARSIDWPADADSALLTIRGGMQLIRGWQAIRLGAAQKIARADFVGAMQGLIEARKLLSEAAARNQHDTVTFALQIRAETFLEGDTATLNALLGRIDAAEEPNLFAALNHVLFASPRWRGSIEKMWQAANDYASNPANAAWLAIAAWAHIEEWHYCLSINRALTPDYVARLQDDGFVEHIRKLDREFWRTADRTKMTRAEAHVAHNAFAFLLRIVRADDQVAAHLERIGPSIAAEPWSYLPDGAVRPTRLLSELRRAAGLPAHAAA